MKDESEEEQPKFMCFRELSLGIFLGLILRFVGMNFVWVVVEDDFLGFFHKDCCCCCSGNGAAI